MADGLVTLPDGVPELTLGWEAILWAGKYLRHANGPRAGKLFRFTDSQVRFLLHFYALTDEGRWVFDRAARRWPKGAGKSPFAAVHALVEFLGPVRLKDLDPDRPGGCVGKPVDLPLVQIAATTLDQTANTMTQVRAMAAKGSRVVADYRLDPGMLRYNTPSGGRLEVITSSAPAAEGAEVTFAVADETEHWTPGRGGHALMDVIERNLSKSNSRLVETCNAWQPGEFSVAEATFDAWEAQQEGRTRGESRILYDARIPVGVDLADEDSLLAGLEFAYGDAAREVGGWVDLRTQRNYIHNGKTKADQAWRFFLNTPTASLDAWVSRREWEALADPGRIVEPGEDVVMFFDGSKSHDATGLVGCCVSDGHVFVIDAWEPDPNDEDSLVPVYEVDAAVARAFRAWNVRGFFADVQEWESFVKVSWPAEYADELEVMAVPAGKTEEPIAWDMRSHTHDFTLAAELTLTEIKERAFTHDGDPRLTRHIANARRRPNRTGVSIGKESRDSPLKIDLAVCAIGARMVRRQLAAAEPKRRRTGRVITGRR